MPKAGDGISGVAADGLRAAAGPGALPLPLWGGVRGGGPAAGVLRGVAGLGRLTLRGGAPSLGVAHEARVIPVPQVQPVPEVHDGNSGAEAEARLLASFPGGGTRGASPPPCGEGVRGGGPRLASFAGWRGRGACHCGAVPPSLDVAHEARVIPVPPVQPEPAVHDGNSGAEAEARLLASFRGGGTGGASPPPCGEGSGEGGCGCCPSRVGGAGAPAIAGRWSPPGVWRMRRGWFRFRRSTLCRRYMTATVALKQRRGCGRPSPGGGAGGASPPPCGVGSGEGMLGGINTGRGRGATARALRPQAADWRLRDSGRRAIGCGPATPYQEGGVTWLHSPPLACLKPEFMAIGASLRAVDATGLNREPRVPLPSTADRP